MQRAVSLRPDLIRTWACGDGPIDVEYVWHDVAQQWQTPGVGEELMKSFTPEASVDALSAAGVPRVAAEESVRHFDDTMKDCILRLYRSAVNVGREWQADVEKVTRPALILWAKDDPYVAPVFAELYDRVADPLLLLRGHVRFFQVVARVQGLFKIVFGAGFPQLMGS